MKIEEKLIGQLKTALSTLESPVVFRVSAGQDQHSLVMLSVLEQIVSLSPFLSLERQSLERTPSFMVSSLHSESGIIFAGMPLGHEFTSFVLSILQVAGRSPKISDAQLSQIKSIEDKFEFESYVSLSCHSCPEVVQALNILAVLNPNIRHTMIDGAVYPREIEAKEIMSVPTVFLNGAHFSSGRVSLEEILSKMGTSSSAQRQGEFNSLEPFDIAIVGAGPAGSAAAIYAARKGLSVALVTQWLGGQLRDTLGIENFVSVKNTQGPQLARELEEHVRSYQVQLLANQRVNRLERVGEHLNLHLDSSSIIKSKSVIIATGAAWRELGVEGEREFRNKGVAYCAHCDGPLFKNKTVAVVGGGNSGVEAAIDLASIARHVTLLEYTSELKADVLLQQRLKSLGNVSILTSSQVLEIKGDTSVRCLVYRSIESGEIFELGVEGVFVQIGLTPNTQWLQGVLELNSVGEIVVDSRNATSVPGVYAAGDCTNTAFKQIMIAMGEGAGAGLGAFEYLLKH